jgi:serine protease Do
MGTGGYMGIGFAIPSNLLQHVMNQLITTGSVTHGFMGVQLQQVTSDIAKGFGLKNTEGALIAEVTKNSPAENAGLKQGDIILEYNSKKVNNIATLRNAVALMRPGANVSLKVVRDGKEITVPLTVGNYPEERAVAESRTNKIGFEVESLTPEIARNMGYINQNGVVVSKVDSGSPAAWAGIKKGALIQSVNNKDVKTVDQFMQQIKDANPEKPLVFLIKQGEYTRFVSIKVG